MDVVILCGGKGTRLSEETIIKPKPMVKIGDKPILWHIIKYYSFFGFNRFILALGYKADYIKQFFSDYKSEYEGNWEIELVDTGLNTLKGGRIKKLEKYILTDNFHLTYGDGLSNIDIKKLVQFHYTHGKLATVSAVRPPSRFGEMVIDGDDVKVFEEKSQMNQGFINGGFFILNKKIMDYLKDEESCDFEFGPMQQIVEEGQLKAFLHYEFWQCMDNVRERDYLNELVAIGEAPWIK